MTEPPLPPSRDDSDEGWGDDVPAEGAPDPALRRLLEERPPHHDRD